MQLDVGAWEISRIITAMTMTIVTVNDIDIVGDPHREMGMCSSFAFLIPPRRLIPTHSYSKNVDVAVSASHHYLFSERQEAAHEIGEAVVTAGILEGLKHVITRERQGRRHR